MPRYFFHTADTSTHRDKHGIELPSSSTARQEAIKFAGALLNENPDFLWDGHDFRVQVTDDKGHLIVTVVMFAVDNSTKVY